MERPRLPLRLAAALLAAAAAAPLPSPAEGWTAPAVQPWELPHAAGVPPVRAPAAPARRPAPPARPAPAPAPASAPARRPPPPARLPPSRAPSFDRRAPGGAGVGAVPYVSGVDVDRHGRLRGYHVDSTPYVSDPFGAVAPFLGTSAAPEPVTVVERHERLAQPSDAVCREREDAALRELLADPATTRSAVAFSDETFRKHALPLVRSQYRVGPSGLVPVYDLEMRPDGTVARTLRAEASALPQPTAEQAESAFRAGGAFTLFRTRTVTVSCGQCGGSGAIVLERVTTDGVAGVRLVSDACPRCHGSGHAERRIDTIYTVTRSSP